MARIEFTPGEQYTLELAAQPSRDLNTALQKFIRKPSESDSPRIQMGRRAFNAIQLLSFHTAELEAPAQVDRGFYGEGEGIKLGRYGQDLEKLSKNKLKLSADPEKSGFDLSRRGDARIWMTLDPTLYEREAIVQAPIYTGEQLEQPDLRMYFIVENSLFTSIPEAGIALNSLRKYIVNENDEQSELRERRREYAQAERDYPLGGIPDTIGKPSDLNKPRTYYASNLHVHQSKRRRPPDATSSSSIRRAA